MSLYVAVTPSGSGATEYINALFIVRVRRETGVTWVTMVTGDVLEVDETPAQMQSQVDGVWSAFLQGIGSSGP